MSVTSGPTGGDAGQCPSLGGAGAELEAWPPLRAPPCPRPQGVWPSWQLAVTPQPVSAAGLLSSRLRPCAPRRHPYPRGPQILHVQKWDETPVTPGPVDNQRRQIHPLSPPALLTRQAGPLPARAARAPPSGCILLPFLVPEGGSGAKVDIGIGSGLFRVHGFKSLQVLLVPRVSSHSLLQKGAGQ